MNSTLPYPVDAISGTHVPSPPVQALRLTLYILVLTLGILGNLLVCLVILAGRKKRNKPFLSTRYFILNLAISDLLVLVMFIPFDLAYLVNKTTWMFGSLMCKLVNTMTYATVVVSGTTLAAISLDRYRVIVHPMRMPLSKACVVGVILGTWIYAIGTLLPFMCSLRILPTGRCVNDVTWWPSLLALKLAFIFLGFLPGFLLPLTTIGVSYYLVARSLNKQTRRLSSMLLNASNARARALSNRRTVRLLTWLVIIYCMCVLPHYLALLVSSFAPAALDTPVLIELHEFTRLLMTANSCANPVLYSAVSTEFRDRLMELVCRKRVRRENSAGSEFVLVQLVNNKDTEKNSVETCSDRV